MRILAVHNSHNASICEIKDGEIIYFQEAERINRIKKSHVWTDNLHNYRDQHVDKFIFVYASESNGWRTDIGKLFVKATLEEFNITYDEFIFAENQHHFFHACCAYFNSGFEESYALITDGSGNTINKDSEIVSLYFFKKNKYKKIFQVWNTNKKEIIKKKDYYINTISLGESYEYLKKMLGYKEEGSVMALSCYARDTEEVIDDNFFGEKFGHFQSISKILGGMGIRNISMESPVSICCSIQKELERIILKYVSNIIKNKKRNLCVSGGVFQNTVLNGKILNICPNLYVDPFADDSGLPMGACMWYSNKQTFRPKKIKNLCLGDFPNYIVLPKDKGYFVTPKDVAQLIKEKNIIAIYQGRNELGKRALGNRSFLYDPTDLFAKERINLLKNREWFRPAAGTVLHEHANEWFDLKTKKETPFMSYVFKVKKKNIPGITHIDNTCRIQTLKKEENFHYYNLIKEFHNLTGVPMLLNTSFNLAGQPLVNSVEDVIEFLCSRKNEICKYIYFPEFGKIYTEKCFK